jgi:hypothetical protein
MMVHYLPPLDGAKIAARITSELINRVGHLVAYDLTVSQTSTHSVFDPHSLPGLYQAGLIVEPKEASVRIVQNHLSRDRWLPELELFNELAHNPNLSVKQQLFNKESVDLFSCFLARLAIWRQHGAEFENDIRSLRKEPKEGDLMGRELLDVKLYEPLAEVRFVSDKLLRIGDDDRSGYLSLIGWTTTRYFRINYFKPEEIGIEDFEEAIHSEWTSQGEVPPIDIHPQRLNIRFDEQTGDLLYNHLKYSAQDIQFKIEVIFATVIDWPMDSKRYATDSAYAKSMRQLFNSKTIRAPANMLSGDSQFAFFDPLRMNYLGLSPSKDNLLREALGAVATTIENFARKANEANPNILYIDSFDPTPSMFVRLALVELITSKSTRRAFIEIFNNWAHAFKSNMSIFDSTTDFFQSDESRQRIEKPLFLIKLGQKNGTHKKYILYTDNQIYPLGKRLEHIMTFKQSALP